MDPPTDISGFASFFEAQFSRVARSVEPIVGMSAEDVAQEAFITALRRWDVVAGLDAPDAWVRLVAKRIAWRRRGREAIRPEREVGALPPTTDHRDAAFNIDLQRALSGLPARQRAAIQLHYLLDMSVRDIAEILDCGESAAKIWLHRGRERLAERLMGHRGRWVTSRRWDVDGLVAGMRATLDHQYVDIVMDELRLRKARWAFTLQNGVYTIVTDEGERLNRGRYCVKGRSVVLTPWDHSGTVVLAPAIDAGRARFHVTGDTTAPTRGVPDEVYVRLRLGVDSLVWTGWRSDTLAGP